MTPKIHKKDQRLGSWGVAFIPLMFSIGVHEAGQRDSYPSTVDRRPVGREEWCKEVSYIIVQIIVLLSVYYLISYHIVSYHTSKYCRMLNPKTNLKHLDDEATTIYAQQQPYGTTTA